MKIQPVQFPYFFYATLMGGGLYCGEIEEFRGEQKPIVAATRGRLFYNKFKDENSTEQITAALRLVGKQLIQGVLFYPNPEKALDLQLKLDELEFNFHYKDDTSNKRPRTRVYLRNLIVCVDENGASHLAWCYIYHSIEPELRKLVAINNDLTAGVEYTPIDCKTYEEMIENRGFTTLG